MNTFLKSGYFLKLGILGFLLLILSTNPLKAQSLSIHLCSSDSDCPLGQICSEGSCQPVSCDSKTDCPNFDNACLIVECPPKSKIEENPTCQESNKNTNIGGCAFDSDCEAGQFCNLSNNCLCQDKDDLCNTDNAQCSNDEFSDFLCPGKQVCSGDCTCACPALEKVVKVLLQAKDTISASVVVMGPTPCASDADCAEAPQGNKCDPLNCVCVQCAKDADCDDTDACTTDTCDSASHTCSHTKIDNCPAPPPTVTIPENPQITRQAICNSNLVSLGFTADDAAILSTQGVCGGNLEGQTARACSMAPISSTVSSWPMILPLFAGTGWIGWMRNFKRRKK